MSCTLSVFAVDAVVWASKSAWHATYEDMLVLERRHSSDVLGLDSVHLLYPRVRRRWLRGRKMRVPLRLRSVRHFPQNSLPPHSGRQYTPTKLQDR
jgi:hypothetical protein